ncbi:hypothetical protein SCA6_001315 [Theobroma cacao]
MLLAQIVWLQQIFYFYVNQDTHQPIPSKLQCCSLEFKADGLIVCVSLFNCFVHVVILNLREFLGYPDVMVPYFT